MTVPTTIGCCAAAVALAAQLTYLSMGPDVHTREGRARAASLMSLTWSVACLALGLVAGGQWVRNLDPTGSLVAATGSVIAAVIFWQVAQLAAQPAKVSTRVEPVWQVPTEPVRLETVQVLTVYPGPERRRVEVLMPDGAIDELWSELPMEVLCALVQHRSLLFVKAADQSWIVDALDLGRVMQTPVKAALWPIETVPLPEPQPQPQPEEDSAQWRPRLVAVA